MPVQADCKKSLMEVKFSRYKYEERHFEGVKAFFQAPWMVSGPRGAGLLSVTFHAAVAIATGIVLVTIQDRVEVRYLA